MERRSMLKADSMQSSSLGALSGLGSSDVGGFGPHEAAIPLVWCVSRRTNVDIKASMHLTWSWLMFTATPVAWIDLPSMFPSTLLFIYLLCYTVGVSFVIMVMFLSPIL